MPMIDLKLIQPSIDTLCQDLAVHRLDLFGSATTAEFGPASDVDVLVEFDNSVGRLFDRYFSLKEGLEALFHLPVDVVMDGNFRNPYFRESVDESRVNIYGKFFGIKAQIG